jgi:hypothetical protein
MADKTTTFIFASLFFFTFVPPIPAQRSFYLVAHQDFGLSFKDAWTARILDSEISIELPGKKARKKHLSSAQLNAISHALEKGDFDKLHARYGCPGVCNDYPVCSLELTTEGKSQRVVVYGVDSTANAKNPEIQRFMSVWRLVKQLSGLDRLKNACP